jgi:hypothetical protein
MAGQTETTQVAGLGEDRERRKQNGSRISSKKATFQGIQKLISNTEIPAE